MDLFIIDGIAPFFIDYAKSVINWSKIPFDNLEKNGSFDWAKFELIEHNFQIFCEKVSQRGFNAITLDDLAHLMDCQAYSAPLRAKIHDYRQAYSRLFAIAEKYSLSVYITTDVMFSHPSTSKVVGRSIQGISRFLKEGCEQLFTLFPQVAGVIFRLGESDSGDIETDFKSHVAIRKPKDARELIKKLLPCFEKHKRFLVVRTWSVGMYAIGDLIWNRNTFLKVFNRLDSDSLIISMKYGESDFFRYLPLNKIFYYSNHKKIIELQARREYEGFGEFPAFVGWEYQEYARQLAAAQNVVGCMVWCQTGGWTAFRRLSYLERSSIWNELNVYVTMQIFKYGYTTEHAIQSFYQSRYKDARWQMFLELLQLSDQVIKDLLYIDDFSGRKMFFRRVRVPPLLWVYWDRIIINHLMRKVLRIYVRDADSSISEGKRALLKIKKMRKLAEDLGINDSGIQFQYDTFRILSLAREYYLLPFSKKIINRLERMKAEYEKRYPTPRYEVELDFKNINMSSKILERLLTLLIRDKRGYRLFDQIITNALLRVLAPLTDHLPKKFLPGFARTRAMGIKAILK